MKKVMMFAALFAALVSCQSKGNSHKDVDADESTWIVADNDVPSQFVYEGTLPSADGPGIRYVLSMDNIDAEGESSYTLITTYLDAEGSGKNKSFTSKGKREVFHTKNSQGEQTVIKLNPDNNDAPIYFIAVNGTTLRLVDENLEEAANGLNYDIVFIQ